MKKHYIAGVLIFAPGLMAAQSAVDAYRLAPQDMKGTARFMSMGGAFGALGGDLTTLSQNPGGIGVYRKQEIGFTIDLDSQRVNAESMGSKTDTKQTKFYLNNIGGVASINLYSPTFRNFNLGFTYNRSASFDSRYEGNIPQLHNSLSNYFAGVANNNMVTDNAVASANAYADGLTPWSSILAYDSYLIFPTGQNEVPDWIGQWNTQTSGTGHFEVEEKGGVNEYNIALGGNIADVVYWGMDFGITDLSYTSNTVWQENLENAYIDEYFVNQTSSDNITTGRAQWALGNYYRVSGSGFNYKLGVIVTPIPELRLGFAFHTPTWYSLKEEFAGKVASRYGNESNITTDTTNDGINGYNEYNFRSPWRFIASAAGVIDNCFILSLDYEWTTNSNMKFSTYNNYGGNSYYDDYYDDWGWYSAETRASDLMSTASTDPYYYPNKDIKEYMTTSSMVRLGVEYRVIPQFSLRAGFAYQTSPVKEKVRNNEVAVYTAGTTPQYTFNNNTTYISMGVGYRYQKFYADLAYQYKYRTADYHAYTPDPVTTGIPSPQSKLKMENNNIVLSMGFRF